MTEIICTKIDDHGKPWRFLPDCEGELTDTTKRWREYSGRHFKCSFSARYCVNGRNLCVAHAGRALINLHVKKEKKLIKVKETVDGG